MPIAARYSTGCTNVLNASPRHKRVYTSASRSTTRNIGGVATASSVLERAAGEDQEDVFEARPRARAPTTSSKPSSRDRVRDRVAVVGVDEHAIGERLDPVAEPLQLATASAATSRRSASRTSTTSRVTLSAISWRGEPSATIRALSMITSRSHSCSASSM